LYPGHPPTSGTTRNSPGGFTTPLKRRTWRNSRLVIRGFGDYALPIFLVAYLLT